MFLSFGRSLRRGFGFRLGFRMRGPAVLVSVLVALCFYLMWWSILGTAYLCWGVLWCTWQFCRGLWWLCRGLWWLCCLPFRALARSIHKKKRPEA